MVWVQEAMEVFRREYYSSSTNSSTNSNTNVVNTKWTVFVAATNGRDSIAWRLLFADEWCSLLR